MAFPGEEIVADWRSKVPAGKRYAGYSGFSGETLKPVYVDGEEMQNPESRIQMTEGRGRGPVVPEMGGGVVPNAGRQWMARREDTRQDARIRGVLGDRWQTDLGFAPEEARRDLALRVAADVEARVGSGPKDVFGKRNKAQAFLDWDKQRRKAVQQSVERAQFFANRNDEAAGRRLDQATKEMGLMKSAAELNEPAFEPTVRQFATGEVDAAGKPVNLTAFQNSRSSFSLVPKDQGADIPEIRVVRDPKTGKESRVLVGGGKVMDENEPARMENLTTPDGTPITVLVQGGRVTPVSGDVLKGAKMNKMWNEPEPEKKSWWSGFMGLGEGEVDGESQKAEVGMQKGEGEVGMQKAEVGGQKVEGKMQKPEGGGKRKIKIGHVEQGMRLVGYNAKDPSNWEVAR